MATKTEIVLYSVGVVTLFTIAKTIVNIKHWISVDFNLFSYAPILPLLYLPPSLIFLIGVYFDRKCRARKFWLAMAYIGILSNVIFMYGIVKTYGWGFYSMW